jgi:hypothetical protein
MSTYQNYEQLNDTKKIRSEVLKRILSDIYFSGILYTIIILGLSANTFMMVRCMILYDKNVLIAYCITSVIYILLTFLKSSMQNLLVETKDLDIFCHFIWNLHWYVSVFLPTAAVTSDFVLSTIVMQTITFIYNYINVIRRYVSVDMNIHESILVYTTLLHNIFQSLILIHIGIYNFDSPYIKILYIISILNFAISSLIFIIISKTFKMISPEVVGPIISELIVFGIVSCVPILALFFVYFPYHNWHIDEKYTVDSIIRNTIARYFRTFDIIHRTYLLNLYRY